MKKTKQGQPLTAMKRAKLRKLTRRGRSKHWHLSRRARRAALERTRASVRKWFDREVAKTLGEVFGPENLRRQLGGLPVTVGAVRVRARGVDV